MADILSDLTNLVTPAILFISQKGDLIYDNLCSDFHEGKALYITILELQRKKSSYVNRKGEIIYNLLKVNSNIVTI